MSFFLAALRGCGLKRAVDDHGDIPLDVVGQIYLGQQSDGRTMLLACLAGELREQKKLLRAFHALVTPPAAFPQPPHCYVSADLRRRSHPPSVSWYRQRTRAHRAAATEGDTWVGGEAMEEWKEVYLYGGGGRGSSSNGLRKRGKGASRGSPIMANGSMMKGVLGEGPEVEY